MWGFRKTHPSSRPGIFRSPLLVPMVLTQAPPRVLTAKASTISCDAPRNDKLSVRSLNSVKQRHALTNAYVKRWTVRSSSFTRRETHRVPIDKSKAKHQVHQEGGLTMKACAFCSKAIQPSCTRSSHN